MFGNGGDRTPENTPEFNLCLELGIEPVWKIGSVEDKKQIENLYSSIINAEEE